MMLNDMTLTFSHDHVGITVTPQDLDATVAWYSRNLSFTVDQRFESHGATFAYLTAGDAKIELLAGASDRGGAPVFITDNVGTIDMNMDLSQKRAQSVRDYLVTKGIPQDLITAQGKGPADPISDNGSIEGRAANRRVELVVSPKKS